MSRSLQPEAPLTVEEFLFRSKDDSRRHELIGGWETVSPNPNVRHQRLSFRLQCELHSRIDGRSGRGRTEERVLAAVNVRLSTRDLFIPDLVVVLEPTVAGGDEVFIDGPPDLVVEITSPSTERNDHDSKRDLYERAGVREYWIVLSDEDAVLRYVRGEEHTARFGEPTRHTERIELSIVDAEPIDLTRIW